MKGESEVEWFQDKTGGDAFVTAGIKKFLRNFALRKKEMGIEEKA